MKKAPQRLRGSDGRKREGRMTFRRSACQKWNPAYVMAFTFAPAIEAALADQLFSAM
jgi:hypothetical protein